MNQNGFIPQTAAREWRAFSVAEVRLNEFLETDRWWESGVDTAEEKLSGWSFEDNEQDWYSLHYMNTHKLLELWVHKWFSKLKKVRKVVRGTVHVILMQSCQNYKVKMDQNRILVPIKQPGQVWKHLRMIHCLQYDGQQANNVDADKNLHIFAHCLNNENGWKQMRDKGQRDTEKE